MRIEQFLPSLLWKPVASRDETAIVRRQPSIPAAPTERRREAFRDSESVPVRASALGGASMLSQAIQAMLQRLEDFLPAPGTPPPMVSLVTAQEKALGLGKRRGIEFRGGFPAILTGLRVASTVRFQLWDNGPVALEAAMSDLTEQLLAQKDALFQEGFLEVELKSVSLSEHVPSVTAWRQTAEFELLYEFHTEQSDDAGGLIASIPVELRESFGSARVAGDLVVWNSSDTAMLRLNGMRSVEGLAVLAFLPGAVPSGSITVRRTFQGAAGAPALFATFDDFLAAVVGSAPAERHAAVVFASLTDFFTALGAGGEVLQFVDELGAPRSFVPRSRVFDQPLELSSRGDRLEIAFGGTALGADQILYLRGFRGSANL